mmetsp:Transcript_11595/g.27002  ORF Transcript_11595/g.27002 Transcript_11595/m.27002 type:complete len:112 (-) Transcript_11595:1280-1615(-)
MTSLGQRHRWGQGVVAFVYCSSMYRTLSRSPRSTFNVVSVTFKVSVCVSELSCRPRIIVQAVGRGWLGQLQRHRSGDAVSMLFTAKPCEWQVTTQVVGAVSAGHGPPLPSV